MGRRPRSKSRKSKPFSENEEREKIKESVLRIFRQRQALPDEGGALLVGPDTIAVVSQTHTPTPKRKTALLQGNSTSDVSDGSMTGRVKKPAIKRRKKGRKSAQKKEKKTSSAVAKHIKVAHGLTYYRKQQPDAVTDQNISSLITESRMTQRLGLFRHGKKSSAVLRGYSWQHLILEKFTQDAVLDILLQPLSIPAHIQEQTDRELKKLVDHNDSSIQQSVGLEEAQRVILKMDTARLPGSRSFSRANTPVSMDVTRPAPWSGAAGYGINDNFPEQLPKRETAVELMSGLKPVNKMLYPGRNLHKEKVEELLKLMKQKSTTPTPVKRLPVHRQVTSRSIQRALVKQFPPDNRSSEEYNPHNGTSRNKGQGASYNVYYGPQKTRTGAPTSQENLESGLFNRNPYKDFDPALRQQILCEQNKQKPVDVKVQRGHSHQDIFFPNSLNANFFDERKETNTSSQWYKGSLASCGNKMFMTGSSDMGKQRYLINDVCIHQNEKGRHRSNQSSYNIDLLLQSAQFLQKENIDTGLVQTSSFSKHGPEGGNKLVDCASCKQDRYQDLMHQHHQKARSSHPGIMNLGYGDLDAAQLLQNFPMQKPQPFRHSCDGQPYEIVVGSGSDRVSQYGDGLSKNNSQCSHCSQSSSQRSQSAKHQAPHVLLRDDFMPSFHGDYYRENLGSRDSGPHEPHRKVESMDILDYADWGGIPDSRSSHIHSPTCTHCKKGLRAMTPNSNVSPDLYPPEHLLAQKPRLDTPDSGPKMYPRHLY